MAAPILSSATVLSTGAGRILRTVWDQNVAPGESEAILSPRPYTVTYSAGTGTGTIDWLLGGPIYIGDTVTVTVGAGWVVDSATGLVSSGALNAQAVTNSSGLVRPRNPRDRGRFRRTRR